MALHSKIKALRLQSMGDGHGAQKRFAQLLGISYTTYRGYEEESKGRVSIQLLVALHEKLGVDINKLLVGEEPQEVHVRPDITPEEQAWLDKLLKVIRNSNTDIAIKQNIDTFLLVEKPSGSHEELTSTYNAAEEEGLYNSKKNNHS